MVDGVRDAGRLEVLAGRLGVRRHCGRSPFALEWIEQTSEQQVVYRRPLSPARRMHRAVPRAAGAHRPLGRPDPAATPAPPQLPRRAATQRTAAQTRLTANEMIL